MRIKKILLGYYLAALAAGLGFAIWRTMLMVRYYDPYMKEYSIEAQASLKVFGIALFVAIIVLASISLLFRFLGKKYEFSSFTASNHQSSTFTSALLGFLFLAVFVFLSFSLSSMLSQTQFVMYKYAQLASYLLLPFVSAYFIINAMESQKYENAKKILSFIPPIWGVAFLLTSYVNPLYITHDFNHSLANVSLAALSLFFLYETKTVILKKPNLSHFVFSLISLVTCMAYILPNFILLAYWELSSELRFVFEAVELGAIIYIASVAAILISSLKKRENPETDLTEYDIPENNL